MRLKNRVVVDTEEINHRVTYINTLNGWTRSWIKIINKAILWFLPSTILKTRLLDVSAKEKVCWSPNKNVSLYSFVIFSIIESTLFCIFCRQTLSTDLLLVEELRVSPPAFLTYNVRHFVPIHYSSIIDMCSSFLFFFLL